jgi:hypothetical protein
MKINKVIIVIFLILFSINNIFAGLDDGEYYYSYQYGNFSDLTGNNNLMNNYGSSNATGYWDSTRSYDGSNDYVIENSASVVDTTMTISVWTKNTFTGSSKTIVSRRQDSSNNQWQLYQQGSADKIYMIFYNGGNTNVGSLISTSTINDGNWHNIIVTQSGNTVKLYIDGTLEDTDTTSGKVTDTQKTTLGAYYEGSGSFYDGQIDEFTLYDRELSGTEVSNLFALTENPYFSDLPILTYSNILANNATLNNNSYFNDTILFETIVSNTYTNENVNNVYTLNKLFKNQKQITVSDENLYINRNSLDIYCSQQGLGISTNLGNISTTNNAYWTGTEWVSLTSSAGSNSFSCLESTTIYSTNDLTGNFNINKNDGIYLINFSAYNSETSVNSSKYNFTIDKTVAIINDTTPMLIQNSTYNVETYMTYYDLNENSCVYKLENNNVTVDYGCSDEVEISEFGTYHYNMIVTDLAGNSNNKSGSYEFDILANIYIQDSDNFENLEFTELNISGNNFSEFSYSNPYQKMISELGSSINYSYSQSTGETVDKNGSINFYTNQTDYYIYVENTPFKMYFNNISGGDEDTNYLIIDSVDTSLYNGSSAYALFIQKQFAKGLVKTIFNYNGSTIFEQQYNYINDLTKNINEEMLILNDLNSIGFFKITDIYGVIIENAIVKVQARDIGYPNLALRTVNQVLTDSTGNTLMYYELGNDIVYWITVSAEGYEVYQNSIDLDNIENGDSSTPETISLKKGDNNVKNGLATFFDTNYLNSTVQIPLYFYTVDYSTIKFKTQYMVDKGIEYVTIPENANLDNIHKYTIFKQVDYSGNGNDITLYVLADDEEFTYTIKYQGEVTEIFSGINKTDNEYFPLITFIGLLFVIVGIRFTFKSDESSVNVFFIGILLMSLITQTFIFGFIVMMMVGTYYLAKGFKRVSENAN